MPIQEPTWRQKSILVDDGYHLIQTINRLESAQVMPHSPGLFDSSAVWRVRKPISQGRCWSIRSR